MISEGLIDSFRCGIQTDGSDPVRRQHAVQFAQQEKPKTVSEVGAHFPGRQPERLGVDGERRIVAAGEDESQNTDNAFLAVAGRDEIIALVRFIPVLPIHQRPAMGQHMCCTPVVTDEVRQIKVVFECA